MRPLAIPLLLLACLLAAVLGLAIGPSGWRLDVITGLLSGDEVLSELRAPRVLLGGLTGASLALAGVSMQSVLGNDLADPYVLGMAGGASAGAVTSLAMFPSFPAGPAAAAGAALATVAVRSIAPPAQEPGRLLLGGVAVGAILASITGLVLVLAPADRLLRSATYWLFGGFGSPAFESLLLPAVALLVGFVLLYQRAIRFDRLALGDDVAATMGTDPRALRATGLGVGIALTALSVAAGGLIGFVGLVAPHAARRLVGAGHRQLIPAAALMGAALVSLADTVARTAFAPREVPVGLITALIGGPLFLVLVGRTPA